MKNYKPREDVAVMLRAGATTTQIVQQLHVASGTITATRTAYGLPAAQPNGGRLAPEARRVVVRRVAKLLREGKTYEEIRAEVGVSQPTICRIRKQLNIPLAKRTRPSRTVAETLALYVEPYGAGHTRWTGPSAGRMPVLWADGREHNARHEAFRAHYGRAPVGYVRAACEEPACFGGSHLTDDLIRERTDATYEAIFGTDTGSRS
ncbi:helix-turn-helix domain-containing protein [Streptomyces sp. NBC_00828]|uniref:helix-turn-helix domain-containing protein n=1 Tax=Streptomyces sp. NBC_00828 TaxID=2903678 RepID=UPI00386BB946